MWSVYTCTIGGTWHVATKTADISRRHYGFPREMTSEVACSKRLDSGEQVNSYAAIAKRNRRGKKRGGTIFFPRQFFARTLIFFSRFPPSERLEQATSEEDARFYTDDNRISYSCLWPKPPYTRVVFRLTVRVPIIPSSPILQPLKVSINLSP